MGFLMACKAQAGRSVARVAKDTPICEVFFCISTECDVQPEFSFGDGKYIYNFFKLLSPTFKNTGLCNPSLA